MFFTATIVVLVEKVLLFCLALLDIKCWRLFGLSSVISSRKQKHKSWLAILVGHDFFCDPQLPGRKLQASLFKKVMVVPNKK